MPKTSTKTATIHADFGIGEEWMEDLDGYTVDIVKLREASDLGPLLKGLPDDLCQCPHWGYLLKGSMTVTYADREEVYEAGDAFYMSPGHSPRNAPDTEFVIFSPKEEFAILQAHFEKAMAAQQQG